MTRPSSATDVFLDAGLQFETDELVRAHKRERIAYLFAAGGILAAVSACVAVAMLTPLKTVEPFVVRVDKSTGATDIITRLDERTVTYNEVIDKYWLARYVNYREEYSDSDAYPNYQAVSLMSSKPVGEAYFVLINPRNARSPTSVYGKEGLVDIAVNSIAFLGNNVAQVRFLRTEKLSNAGNRETHWIATINYQYLKSPMKETDRLINPTGFQVTEYRLDAESVPTGS
jgi:type IV secretion system protein VirB8